MSGNVITGIKSACALINGGMNDQFNDNICDIGSGPYQQIILDNNSGFTSNTGNTFENNVVVAGSSGPGQGFCCSPVTPPTIQGNAYFNYVIRVTSSKYMRQGEFWRGSEPNVRKTRRLTAGRRLSPAAARCSIRR